MRNDATTDAQSLGHICSGWKSSTVQHLTNAKKAKTAKEERETGIQMGIINMLALFVMLAATTLEVTGFVDDIELTLDDQEVRASTTYTFVGLTSSKLLATQSLRVTFPSAIGVTDGTLTTCTVKYSSPERQTTPTCTASSNVVTITSPFDQDATGTFTPLTIVLGPITNPLSSTTTSSISVTVLSSAGATVQSDSTSTVTATPAEMQSASIATSSDTIGEMNTWTFTFTPTYEVPSGSGVAVTFPYWNEDLTTSSSKYLAYIRSTPTCSGLNNIQTVLSCSFAHPTLKISSAFNSATTGPVEFSVSGIYNPPNPNSATGFEIAYIDASSGEYEVSPAGVSVQVSTPNSLDSVDIALSDTTVSTVTDYTFTIDLHNPIYSGCKIIVEVPTEVGFDASVSAVGLFGVDNNIATTSVSGQEITIEDLFTNYKDSVVMINLSTLTNPASTATPGDFQVSTLTPAGGVIDTLAVALTSVTAGDVTQYQTNDYIAASPTTVGNSATYTIDFETSHTIPISGYVTVEFPSEIEPTSRSSATACTSIINGLNAAAKCGVSGQVLTVYDGFTTSLSPGRIAFTINLITNAPSTKPSSSFTIRTHPASGTTDIIDESTASITVTATAASLTSVAIASSSGVTGARSEYTFTVVTTNKVTTNGYLYIVLPTEVSITDTTNAEASCTQVQGFTSSAFECVVTTSTIRVNGFNAGSFSPGTLEFVIDFLQNPPSTEPSATFQVSTHDSLEYTIDQKLTGNFVTMTTANTLQGVTITPSSLVNGELTDYTISITVQNETPVDAKVRVVPPSTVTFNDPPTCTASTGITGVSCSLDGTDLVATITASSVIASGSSFSFVATQTENPPTTEQTTSFQVYTYTNDDYAIDKKETGIKVQTTTAGTITDITITADDTLISAVTSYVISYFPINPHPIGTELSIIVPSGLSLGTVSCSSTMLDAGLSCTKSSNTITVTNGFTSEIGTSTRIDITVGSITNPAQSTTVTGAWDIQSKVGSFLIDKSNDQTSSFTCSGECATCQIDPATCTSCDLTGLFPYLYSNQCNAECDTGYTDDQGDATVECVQCQTPCVTCQDSPTTCTSCDPDSSYPFLYSDTCNASCGPGTYGDSTSCLTCPTGCATCDSDTICTSCTTNDSGAQTYLLNDQCLEDCGDGYDENGTTYECDSCGIDCLTCEGGVNTCTSCSASTYLLNGKCLASCPTDGTYIVVGNVCYACSTPCETCEVTTSTCLSCLDGEGYLYQSQCVSVCPDDTVLIGSKCKTCVSPCADCETTVTTCTSCDDDYYLQGNLCKNPCDDGYFIDGLSCTACDSATSFCKTCETSATHCLSCLSGYYLYENTCVTSCPANTHVPYPGECRACDSPCLECSGSTTTCTACTTGMKLHNNDCVSACPTDTTIESNVGGVDICEDCSSKCATCETAVSQCTGCNSPYVLQDTTCVDQCSTSYVLVGDLCDPCDSTCLTCSGATTTCTSCPANNYLYEAQCLSECPEGYYPSLGECLEIVNSAECSTGCTDELFNNDSCEAECNVLACSYDNGNCVVGETSCPDGEYQVGDACFACSSPCDKCAATSYCLSCESVGGVVKLLHDNYCYDSCPAGSYKISDLACDYCSTGCEECTGTATTCTACATGKFLYNEVCYATCPIGTTIENSVDSTCDACNANCRTCTGTTTTCNSCADSSVLQDTTCQVSCDSGYTTTTATGNVCQACDDSCKECQDATSTCTACEPDSTPTSRYLHDGSCLYSCPVGYYGNIDECDTCPTGCAECTSSTVCSLCSVNYVLYNSNCLTECPAGYEDDDGDGVCDVITVVECATGCTDEMLNNSECNAACNVEDCNYDMSFCISDGTCNAGQYYDGSNCVSCSSPCKTCESEFYCLSCEDNVATNDFRLLYGSTCVDECAAGTYQVGIECLDCDSECTECAGAADTCIACAADEVLYNGDCLVSCPTDTTVEISGECLDCDTNCATCASNARSECTSCTSPKVLQEGSCVTSCSSGFTLTTSSPDECQPCTSPCTSCSGKTTTCLSCSTGFLHNSACKTSCPTDTTVEVGSECIDCTSPCAQCSGSADTCTLCEDSYYLHLNECLTSCPSGYEPRQGVCTALCAEGCTQALLINSDCDLACSVLNCNYDNMQCDIPDTCEAGQYYDGDTEACTACVYPCLTCASEAYCTACDMSDTTGLQLYIYDGQCLDDCSDGTYLSGIVCLECDSSCETCETDADRCLSCATGKYLYGTTCVSSCPIGTTVLIGSECIDCDANCEQCESLPDLCTACPDGSVLMDTTCDTGCDPGFTTTTSSNGECEACAADCETCLGAKSYCTSCDGKILHNNNCISTCPSGYTNIDTDPFVCTQCSSNCAECESTIDNCTTCPSGEYLTSSNTCQTTPECTDGFTTTSSSGSVCLECVTPCVTCQTEVDNCITCIDGKTLVNSVCEDCTSPCVTCTGSQTSCLSCIEGYFLQGLTCVACDSTCRTCSGTSFTCTGCYSGYVFEDATDTCVQCNDVCEECGPDANTCTQCADGMFLEDNTCKDCNANCLTCSGTSTTCQSCEDGRFLNSATDTCDTCDTSCATCNNIAEDCTSCDPGLTLINKRCGFCDPSCETCLEDFSGCATCPDGEDLVSKLCGICNTNCATCSGDFNTCGSCNDGMYLVGGVCLSCDSNCQECESSPTQCTACKTSEALISNACVACDLSCETCSGSADFCTSCAEGLSLLAGDCLVCDGDCATCSGTTSTCVTCFEGWYLSGSTCLKCDDVCKTCETNAGNCISCPLGSEIVDNTCERDCSDGKFLQDGNCINCDIDCATCYLTATYCTSCVTGVVYEGDCISSCPSGFYENTSSQCEACSSLCLECQDNPVTCIACEDGYRLENSVCILICPDGQYYDGSSCQECDDNCLTCTETATTCTSCNLEEEAVNNDNECEVPCDPGYTRTDTSGELCVSCASQCETCDNEIDYCTECSSSLDKLYQGLCLDTCPPDITVDLGDTCEACDDSCLTCKTTPWTCTSCYDELLLYANACVSACPQGYYENAGECTECENVYDCPATESSVVEEEEDEAFDSGPVPFPFSGAVAISACSLAVVKATAVGMSLVPSVVAIWSVQAVASWGFAGSYILVEEDTSRRLTLVDGQASSFGLRWGVLVLLGALFLQFVCNMYFLCQYIRRIVRTDKTFKYWRKEHQVTHTIVLVIAAVFNFNFIRMLTVKLCNLGMFSAEFTNRGRLYKLLLKLGYFSLFCCNLAMVVGLIILLMHFPKSNWMWMFCLDSLIITILLSILTAIDLIQMESALCPQEIERKCHIDARTLVPATNSEISKILLGVPHYDFRSVVPDGFKLLAQTKKEKFQSQSAGPSRVCTPVAPRVKRKSSFPLMDDDEVYVDPILFNRRKHVPVHDEPNSEDHFLKPRLDETILLDVEQFPRGEFSILAKERKNSVKRPENVRFKPLPVGAQVQEYSEVVAFTEHAASEEEDSSESPPESVHEPSPMRTSGQPLPTIREEDELEIEKAIPDPTDPELVKVHYKPLNQRVTVRKSFNGARIVDLNNRPLDAPPIDSRDYNMPATIVDEKDVRFATLTAKTGKKVRVRRSFKGARIVDLERKAVHPSSRLVGEVIKDESDLNLHRARPDAHDPETIVVQHNATGEQVRVTKSFHEAMVVDANGNAIPGVASIDRNNFDIPKTIVDQEDVHLATLMHKYTQARVRVRRNFIGARITDLESKARAEPEPSEPEPPRVRRGWVEPPVRKELSPSRERLSGLADVINELEGGRQVRDVYPSNIDFHSSDEESPPARRAANRGAGKMKILEDLYAPQGGQHSGRGHVFGDSWDQPQHIPRRKLSNTGDEIIRGRRHK